LPTATDDALGGEKFGLGPTAVALKQQGPWTYGALANHVWSVAGDDDREDVNATFLQPFLSYITATHTTFGLNTESTYDWQNDQWSVPINLTVAQLLKIGCRCRFQQAYATGRMHRKMGRRIGVHEFSSPFCSQNETIQHEKGGVMSKRKRPLSLCISTGAMLIGGLGTAGAQVAMDRTVLPVQAPERQTYAELDARNAKMPPHFEVNAPKGAPNMVIILIDDLGFGATQTYGGPIPTPTLDRLAANGLIYNNFHTTALSSPTRAALKSGRNHHTVNMGFITEMATGFPGATGQIPNTTAPLAEMLRLNGYSTAAFGKWHETAAWVTSVSGPFDRWPTRQGFDKFYGFIGGETNQWAPYLYDGLTQVELPEDPDYHFMTDMTDKAVSWVKYQKAITPDKPLFVYFAPGATHAPHHVSKEWIAKWKGKFDQGWDKMREETFARQLKMGVIPQGTKLAPKPDDIRDWEKLSDEEKRLYARQMEVFAAFLDYTDHEIGRMLKAVEATGKADNTLVFYIVGDNGASAEGSYTTHAPISVCLRTWPRNIRRNLPRCRIYS